MSMSTGYVRTHIEDMRKKKALSAWIPLVSVFCSSGAVSGIRGKQMTPAVASERSIFSKIHDYNAYTRPRVFCACILTAEASYIFCSIAYSRKEMLMLVWGAYN